MPDEVIEVDYGCGDPTRWLQKGDTVLDLGSGSGKICYLASQIVGSEGRVIGVDFNQPMLALARKHQSGFASRVGYDNLSFLRGRIQDLALNLDALESWLAEHPVRSADDFQTMQERIATLRKDVPMVADDSVDCIVSNCVLNLVEQDQKGMLFDEMYRVLKRGGRCVISDIVSDEVVPAHLQADSKLWGDCVSGAFEENAFLNMFEQRGFYGMEIVERGADPYAVVEGIEFRSVTIRAYKGKEGACLDRKQAVIYRGPWKTVTDDDGHTLHRSRAMAVCDKTFNIYTREPYADDVVGVRPHMEVPLREALPFDCSRDAFRVPGELKGADHSTSECASGDCC